MHLETLSNEELVTLIQQDHKLALDVREVLLKRFKKIILFIGRRYFIPGFERDDILQHGRIGFLEAIRDFDSRYGTSFNTFAKICISRELLNTLVLHTLGKKIIPYGCEVTFNEIAEGIKDESDVDPQEIVLDKEEAERFLKEFLAGLSDLERKVFQLSRIEGLSYKEIASRLNISKKSVDNALQRIRRKKINSLTIDVPHTTLLRCGTFSIFVFWGILG